MNDLRLFNPNESGILFPKTKLSLDIVSNKTPSLAEKRGLKLGLTLNCQDNHFSPFGLGRDSIKIIFENYKGKKARFSILENYSPENIYRNIKLKKSTSGENFLAIPKVASYFGHEFYSSDDVSALLDNEEFLEKTVIDVFNDSNIFTIKSNGSGKPIFEMGGFPIMDRLYEFVKPCKQEFYLFDRKTNFHNGFPKSPKNENRLVTCAGDITFKDGKIINITNRSGHFCPNGEDNIKNVLKVLAKMLPEDVELIDCFHNSVKKDGAIEFDTAPEGKIISVSISDINIISRLYKEKSKEKIMTK